MSIPNTSEKSVDLDRQENITKGNVSAKKIVVYTYDSSNDQLLPVSSQTLGTQLTTSDRGLVTNTIIHGKTTAGGGSYVDVKVNPSGALVVATTPNVLTERYDVQGTTIYVGAADEGTLESDATWTIIKYDLADMTAGSGKVATNAVWDDHTTETYL